MKGWLQRLAGQAVPGGAPRVRAAASVRAAPPLIAPADPDPPTRGTRFASTGGVAHSVGSHDERSSASDAFPKGGPLRFAFDPYAGSAAGASPSPAIGDATLRVTALPPEFEEAARLVSETRPPFDAVRASASSASSDAPLGLRDSARSTIDARTHERGQDEVHVHIGRIEVTAVHEPTRARPKRGATHPTKSLEDYLAGRPRRGP